MSTSGPSFGAGAGAATMLAAVVGALWLWAGPRAAAAEATNQPCRAIVERNVFGLRAPPPAARQESPPPRPAATFILTGITTIFGAKRALLKTQTPARAGQPPVEQSYILAEGQREGELQVLAVDEKAGTVKVDYAGLVTTLNFADNGVRTASGPPTGVRDGRLAPVVLPPQANAGLATSPPPASRQESVEKIRVSRRLAFPGLPQ